MSNGTFGVNFDNSGNTANDSRHQKFGNIHLMVLREVSAFDERSIQ